MNIQQRVAEINMQLAEGLAPVEAALDDATRAQLRATIAKAFAGLIELIETDAQRETRATAEKIAYLNGQTITPGAKS